MAPFRRFVSQLLATGILTAAAPFATAQNAGAAETPMGVLHFTFRDSVTGQTVKPDAILVDGKMVFNNLDEAGRMSVPVTPGDHQVVFKANGYNDLDSRQTAALDHAPLNMIMLDPSQQPPQLLPENLSKDMPADGTVIVGFVTDDTTGAPVPGADVELLEKDVKVKTDGSGFFKLPLSFPDGKQMPEDPRGVRYSTTGFKINRNGYGFEERLNVLVETGTPRIYQVTLIRSGFWNFLKKYD